MTQSFDIMAEIIIKYQSMLSSSPFVVLRPVLRYFRYKSLFTKKKSFDTDYATIWVLCVFVKNSL